jgi:hypothetical protein
MAKEAHMSDFDGTLISGERVAFTTYKHWAAVVTASFWAILMLLGAVAVAWAEPSSSTGLRGFIRALFDLLRTGLIVGGLSWIIYNVIAWRTAAYVVTTQRVLGREGLIRRRSTDTLLASLSDVRTVIPAAGKALGYGTIRIIASSGEAGEDQFTMVRQVEAFKKAILEQKTGSSPIAARDGPTPSIVGVQASAPPVADPAGPTAQALTTQVIVQTLGELARLRDAGAITPEEYDGKKAELLSRI